jgi:ATP-dependent DNA helicase RecG
MDQFELIRRIEKWEDFHTEFKEWPIHNDDLAASLVAFANTDSGQLILGVNKNHEIVGVNDSDKTMQRVDQVAYQNCEPPLTVVQETIRADGGAVVVVVNVPKGDQRPYRTNRGVYYIRTTSGRQQASRQELLRLFQSSESLYYDETLVLRASLGDLDINSFESFVNRVYQESPGQLQADTTLLLRNLGLVKNLDGKPYPTIASLLFFGRNPQQFIPHAYITLARIPGSSLAAPPSDAKSVDGVLPVMLEDTARFLRIHLQTAHQIRGFEPENRPEIPEEVLRELLVNSLAHRDYTVTAPIRVFVYDDRVEIRTPGGLPNTVSIEAMKLGAAHVLRNPIIYTLFSRIGLVTGIGSGVYRSILLVKETSGKDLGIFLEANELVFSIPRRVEA